MPYEEVLGNGTAGKRTLKAPAPSSSPASLRFLNVTFCASVLPFPASKKL